MRSFIIFTKNLLKRGFDIMAEIWSGVNVKSMSVIYAYLILDGTCTFKEVVKYFKSDTAVVLVSLGAEDKITDQTYLEEAKQRIEQANQAK